MKKLYTIYYETRYGKSKSIEEETVASSHRPTHEEALKFIATHIEGGDEGDRYNGVVKICEVVEIVSTDMQTLEFKVGATTGE